MYFTTAKSFPDRPFDFLLEYFSVPDQVTGHCSVSHTHKPFTVVRWTLRLLLLLFLQSVYKKTEDLRNIFYTMSCLNPCTRYQGDH